MKSFFQHHCNVLHIYCRLVPFCGCKKAKAIAKWYGESMFHKLIYV